MDQTRSIVQRALLSSLIILSFVAAGCDNSESGQNEPVTFSVLYNDVSDAPFRADWLLLEEYAKRQNVTLDVSLGADAAYDDAIRRVVEAGSIPDIVLKVWPQDIESYAHQGLLLPFSDHQDLMPYFTRYISEHDLGGELERLRLGDGKFYILPGYQREIQVQQWIYRRDLFERHDLDTPRTYDEMFNALVVLKQLYPESAPLTATWGGAHLLSMMGAGYETTAGWDGIRNYNWDEDRFEFSPATDNYREMYRFLSRCYEAGILDPETLTQSWDEYVAKLTDGRAMITVAWITSGFASWNTQLEQNGHAGGEWAPLPVPATTLGTKALPPVDRFRKGLFVPARVATEPYLERLIRFLDWAVYSDEGRTLTTWGVEGVTFERTEDGKRFLSGVRTPSDPAGSIPLEAEFGMNLMFNLNEDPEFEDQKKPAEIVRFLNASQQAGDAAQMRPRLQLDDDSGNAARVILEKLQPYVEHESRRFITGELDVEQDWDAYLAELRRLGYETLEAIWNTAWREPHSSDGGT